MKLVSLRVWLIIILSVLVLSLICFEINDSSPAFSLSQNDITSFIVFVISVSLCSAFFRTNVGSISSRSAVLCSRIFKYVTLIRNKILTFNYCWTYEGFIIREGKQLYGVSSLDYRQALDILIEKDLKLLSKEIMGTKTQITIQDIAKSPSDTYSQDFVTNEISLTWKIYEVLVFFLTIVTIVLFALDKLKYVGPLYSLWLLPIIFLIICVVSISLIRNWRMIYGRKAVLSCLRNWPMPVDIVLLKNTDTVLQKLLKLVRIIIRNVLVFYFVKYPISSIHLHQIYINRD